MIPARLLVPAAIAALGVWALRPATRVADAATAATTATIRTADRSRAVRADTVVLRIDGMTCGGCTLATRKVIERLTGVTKADVSYEKSRAVVTYDPARVSVKQMIDAVATLKYVATEQKR